MDTEKIIKTGTRAQRLNMEIGSRLITTFGGQDMAVKAMLVGMEPGHCLVLQLPEIMCPKDFLFAGNTASVRYISWGMVFGFQSRIIGDFSKNDLNLVILAYPRTIKTYDSRKEPRTESFVEASLVLNEEIFTGHLLDLSSGGCRFVFDSSLKKPEPTLKIGQKTTISFKLPGLKSTQVFACRTQNFQYDDKTISLGLQFDLEAGAAFSPDDVLEYLEKQKKNR